ncbi:DUF4013 domain-containing protein [Halorientalis pallida]|uniref:DUF4013 domain-containing protein n=1 Tax=Halorientalis pallida TaxID=2479928 RepID=UPI003C6EF438
MGYCDACGTELDDEMNYCSNCGQSVKALGPETNPEGKSPFEGGVFSLSLGYSFQNDKRPLVIGGLITLAGMIVPFVGWISTGYGFQLCRAVARGQTQRPDFDDYGEMFIDGMWLTLVVLVYGGAFMALVFALVLGATQANEPVALAGVLGLLVLLLYLLPGALTVVAATEEMGAAFSTEYLVPFVLSGTYLKAMVLWTVLSVGLWIALFLSIFTIVGFPFVSALFNYVAGTFWGYFYREAAERGDVPPAPDLAV